MGVFSSGAWRTAEEAIDIAIGDKELRNKVFVITGPYSGIGAETCKVLLSRSASVVLGGRSAESQKKFSLELKAEYDEKGKESFVDDSGLIDLSDLDSVRDFAFHVRAKYNRVDGLILNAGVMFSPPGVTKQGIEMQVGVNVIGHFLLAKLLEEITARQVWVSSDAHWILPWGGRFNCEAVQEFNPNEVEKKYDRYYQYQQSKMGNVLLAKAFAKRGMESVSLHPGVIRTNLTRHMDIVSRAGATVASWLRLMKTPQQGAATTITCTFLNIDDPQWKNGGFYSDCVLTRESRLATLEDADKLFELCNDLTLPFQKSENGG